MMIHEMESIKSDLYKEQEEVSALKAEIEEKLKAEIKEQFEDLILEYDDSVVVQHVTISDSYGLYVHVDFGFIDQDNKIDFGSSFSLTLSSVGIQINYGSIGPFGVTDKYQVKRLRVLNKMFDDWCRVQEILSAESFKEYLVTGKVLRDIELSIDNVDKGIFEAKKEDILSQIKVGTEVKYTEDTPYRVRAFNGSYTNEVQKIATKFIYLTTPYGAENRIEKNTFVAHVLKGYLIIK